MLNNRISLWVNYIFRHAKNADDFIHMYEKSFTRFILAQKGMLHMKTWDRRNNDGWLWSESGIGIWCLQNPLSNLYREPL